MKHVPHISLSVLFCLFGILLGIWFDAEYHPNYMMMWVDPANQLDVAPQENDIVQWRTIDGQLKTDLVQVHFDLDIPGLVPCRNENSEITTENGVCFVHYPNPDGTYHYTCNDRDQNQICDPNYAPASTSGKGTGLSGEGKGEKPHRLGSLHALGPFRYFKALVNNFAASNVARALRADTVKIPFRAAVSTASGTVVCQGSNTVVIPSPADPRYPGQIVVGSQGKIYWSSPYDGNGFTLDLNGICTDSGNPNPCVLKENISGQQTYKVKANDPKGQCKDMSTQTIMVTSGAERPR
jgi:hypothetical protein